MLAFVKMCEYSAVVHKKSNKKKCETFSPFWNSVSLEGLIVSERSEKGHSMRTKMLSEKHSS